MNEKKGALLSDFLTYGCQYDIRVLGVSIGQPRMEIELVLEEYFEFSEA